MLMCCLALNKSRDIIIVVLADCLVAGQIHSGCASPCATTCANMNTTLICPAVCIINGCQCPYGTVIDEQSNACVPPSECGRPFTGINYL